MKTTVKLITEKYFLTVKKLLLLKTIYALICFILIIKRQKKKALKKFVCTKKPFGYLVVHHMLIKFLKSLTIFLSPKYLILKQSIKREIKLSEFCFLVVLKIFSNKNKK